MQINFYTTFTKKPNSTARPSESISIDTLIGHLRDACSVTHPIIDIEPAGTGQLHPYQYTYAHIPIFNRYYYIEDWTWNNGLWQVTLTEDVLASWKPWIGELSAYVERAASEYDGEITDRLYPVKCNAITERVSLSSTWNGVAPSGGCFVLGVLSAQVAGLNQLGGAVTYYVLSSAQMAALMTYLMSDTFVDDAGFPVTMTPVQQLAHETAKALINPAQYIVSCMFYPVTASVIGDGINHSIYIGYYGVAQSHLTGQLLQAHAFTMNVTGTLPTHPQSATRGEYLNHAPYTRMTLNLPPFGDIPMDLSYIPGGSYLKGQVYVDTLTGKANLQCTVQPDSQTLGSGAIILSASSQMGVPVQIAQLTPDYLSAFSSAIGTGMNLVKGFTEGAASSGSLSGGLSSMAGQALMQTSTIQSAIESLMPQREVSGVSGSYLAEIMNPLVTAEFFELTDEDNDEVGKPLMKKRTINTLSGFIKCADVAMNIPAYQDERAAIMNYMMSGFFWE